MKILSTIVFLVALALVLAAIWVEGYTIQLWATGVIAFIVGIVLSSQAHAKAKQ